MYEALPGVLLGLHERTSTAPRTRQPAWFTVTGHTGSQDFDRSTVGTDYDIDYFQARLASTLLSTTPPRPGPRCSISMAPPKSSSPVQGGDIDMQGLELSLALCRGCEAGEKYVLGQFSLGRYTLDLDSHEWGRLKSGVDAHAYSLVLEAGRRLQRKDIQLTPRVRLEHASVDIDRFTDPAVHARVSYPDEERLAMTWASLQRHHPKPRRRDCRGMAPGPRASPG